MRICKICNKTCETEEDWREHSKNNYRHNEYIWVDSKGRDMLTDELRWDFKHGRRV